MTVEPEAVLGSLRKLRALYETDAQQADATMGGFIDQLRSLSLSGAR